LQNTTESEFYGPNLGYVLELYEKYKEDPDSVDKHTQSFFESWSPPESGANGHSISGALGSVSKLIGAAKYIRSIRDFGHRAAQLDPLGSEPPGDPALDPGFHDVSEDDLEALPAGILNFPGTGPIPQHTNTAKEAIDELWRIYCKTSGYDFGHIHNASERFWLREAVESERFNEVLEGEDAKTLLRSLTQIDTLEKFLHKTFLGQKRFSVEGVDMVVPMLSLIVRFAADKGTPEVVLGMAHRGRLNILSHVVNKSYAKIFGEFQQPDQGEKPSVAGLPGEGWVGDVKYHMGIRGSQLSEDESEQQILINLAPNPSHLEHINPVVEGMARAAQETREQAGPPKQDEQASLPILIHGDAAFTGEGVVAETLNLYKLPGYKTGGTIHIITDNQLGFTTEEDDARSTLYASDLAKGYEIPVIHVNADDPGACLAAVRFAYAYREEFHKDFMIDLIGYRRFGHNEGDEPAYTQPKMYDVVREHPSVREIFARDLEERGIISEGEAEQMVEEMREELKEILDNPSDEVNEEDIVADQPHTPLADIPETAVSEERLSELNQAMLERPEGFNANEKLERLFQKNRSELNDGIDWAHAETLAFASLLEDGVPIRLTGQDTERGTFSQRHSVLHDVESGDVYVPLQNIPQASASFISHNSPLSEIAALGFEYGYTLNAQDALVLWEAQYGDFANVGQAIIDEFIVSGQAKWGQTSGLVMLLPHGYEGQGPDHSSARLERFLQLAAHDNIRVANCTTAAQYFHLLRAQAMLKDEQRPLIIMTPKSLLRHPLANAKLEELTEGKFRPVLDDEEGRERAESVERLILCSGKIYTDLMSSEAREEDEVTAVVRIELLYPFPEEDVQAVINGYPNLKEIVWVQEEPKNMGAWAFMEPRLRELVGGKMSLGYVGKPRRPSPAQGSAAFHKKEQAAIVRAAFKGVEGSEDAREREEEHVN
jgi:2-oxoglutarate dehydrogenase E1 component